MVGQGKLPMRVHAVAKRKGRCGRGRWELGKCKIARSINRF